MSHKNASSQVAVHEKNHEQTRRIAQLQRLANDGISFEHQAALAGLDREAALVLARKIPELAAIFEKKRAVLARIEESRARAQNELEKLRADLRPSFKILPGSKPQIPQDGVELPWQAIDFRVGETNGLTAPEGGRPADVTDVVKGLLGWSGAWVSIPFTSTEVQLPAFRLDQIGSGDGEYRYGVATLDWCLTEIPRNGIYRFDSTDSPLWIRGYRTVKGRGNYFTSTDAKADVCALMTLALISADGKHKPLITDWPHVTGDATRSEDRTRFFRADLPLPTGVLFEAAAGDKVSFSIELQLSTWANSDGAARIDICTFGIPAVRKKGLVGFTG